MNLTFILFGATGDLATRKLWPALYHLAKAGRLPASSRVVAAAYDIDSSFEATVRAAICRHAGERVDDDVLEQLLGVVRPVCGSFDDAALYDAIGARLPPDHSRVVSYLAVAPDHVCPIAEGLAGIGLGRGGDRDAVVIVEKPFGTDRRSAQALTDRLHTHLDEAQILRIDHYLGKETVQNLLVFRFGNRVFEPLWNESYVDHVQITVAEELGIGSRAGYYDAAGAMRDILQNHVLQLLALIGMEAPSRYAPDEIRDEKVKLLRTVKVMSEAEVADSVVRGQYTAGRIDGLPVSGYQDERGVPDGSSAETYVAARLEVANWRWAGVPFFVRTGKRMAAKSAEIVIQFKAVPHMPFVGQSGQDVTANQLIISIQPLEKITLQMVAKRPGSNRVAEVPMQFSYGQSFQQRSPEAYERLLLAAVDDDRALFAGADEVDASWRIVEPILDVWAASSERPDPYEAGSQGPAAADALIESTGRSWRHV